MGKPTEPGYYWYTDKKGSNKNVWIIVEVNYDWSGEKLLAHYCDCRISINGSNSLWGEWIPSNEELAEIKDDARLWNESCD